MALVERATFAHIVSLLLLVSLSVAKPAFADDLTGMAHDDPKDLYPAPAQQASCSSSYDPGFLPMPGWARGATMPPLPATLKPMGKKIAVLTTPPVAAPQPLAPPKDAPSGPIVAAKPAPAAPAPAPAQSPALIAVSPFLDWIKSNPHAAAEQARQQASTYQAGADANAAAQAPNAAPNNNAPAPAAGGESPYWLPPLIDAAPFGSGNVTGSSAAIYSTPQR